jgi:dihydrofolate reductase
MAGIDPATEHQYSKGASDLLSISPAAARRSSMRKLLVHEFVTLDGIMQAPGGPDEDRDGGFTHGGWTRAYWHDDIGATFGALMQDVDAFLLGRRTYVTHAQAFEPLPPGDPFGDLMNAPAKYVVSRTLDKPIWRNTTIIRDDVVAAIRALKAGPGKTIVTDGSSQLVHALIEHDLVDELYLHVYPIALGRGKRVFPAVGFDRRFTLAQATPYPTGVVGLRYTRAA